MGKAGSEERWRIVLMFFQRCRGFVMDDEIREELYARLAFIIEA